MRIDRLNSRPHVYKGNLAYNQRTLLRAFSLLNGFDESGQDLRNTPIKLSDLTSLLLLLEALAMSSAFIVDGTLPPGDVARLSEQLDTLTRVSGITLDLSFVKPKRRKLVQIFKQSSEMSTLLLEQFDVASLSTETPLTFKDQAEMNRFRNLIKWAVTASPGERLAEANDIAASAFQGRDVFRGSKCVAGILVAESEDMDIRAFAAEMVPTLTDDGFCRFASMLVNRFRINYVNVLAEQKKAAFLADSSIGQLRSAQVVLFWRYLLKKAGEKLRSSLPQTPDGLLEDQIAAAPLGLAILLGAPGANPIGLLLEAQSLRNRRFTNVDVAVTAQERFIHEYTEEEFGEFQEYLYSTELSTSLRRDRQTQLSRCIWREVRLPIGGATFAYTFLSALGQGALPTALGSLGTFLLTGLMEDRLSKRWSKEAIIADSYRRLEDHIMAIKEQPDISARLVSRVSTVFGRPLEWR